MSNLSGSLPLTSLPGAEPSIFFDGNLSTSASALLEYERRNLDSPNHLPGDFAYVISDPLTQSIFCARDPFGVRPLYYSVTPDRFVFGSELRDVLGHPGVSRKINEGMIAEFLCGQVTSRLETFYSAIHRLPPGHCLVISDGSTKLHRYWTPDLDRTASYKEDEYPEALLELLTASVHDRLRSCPTGIATELSGGLDSSSITALAASELNGNLKTYSLTYPGESCDESAWLRSVTRHCGVTNFEVASGTNSLQQNAAQCAYYHDLPDYPNGTVSEPLRKLASASGIRTLLTGIGGDECFAGSPLHYADRLRNLHLASLTRELYGDRRAAGSFASLVPWIKRGLKPLVRLQTTKVPAWIDPTFARRVNLADRLNALEPAPSCRSLSRLEMYRTLTSGWSAHLMEMNHRGATRDGLSVTHPFLDRRVVDFAFSLPENQKLRSLRTKYILRRAMRGKLPDDVLARNTKAEFSSCFERPLSAFYAQSHPRIIADYLQTSELARLTSSTASRNKHLWPLWNIVGVHMWAQSSQADAPALTRTLAHY